MPHINEPNQTQDTSADYSRRRLLTGLAATAGVACCASATEAFSGKERVFYGDQHSNRRLTQTVRARRSSLAPSGDVGRVRILPNLGNSAIDQLVLQERTALNSAFGVLPDLYVFDDHGVPNAFALPRSRSGRGTGTILLGRTLVMQEIKKAGYTTASLKGIMAHEWSHIVQFRERMQMDHKHRELHADFMAGWYLRRAGMLGADVDFQTFANTLFAKGDFSVGTHIHHGKPSERVNAMLLGSQHGDREFWATFRFGERMIRTRFA